MFNTNLTLQDMMKKHPVSFLILILNSAFFVLLFLLGAYRGSNQETSRLLIEWGAIVEPLLIQEGEWWRLLTSMFMHGSFIHFIMNMLIGVFVLGTSLERLVGSLRFALIYFISGLGGGIAIILFYLFSGNNPVITIGASGAIYGVMGSLLYLTMNRASWFSPQEASSIRGLVLVNIIFTFLASNISVSGHIGGLVVGYLIAALIKFNTPYSNATRKGFTNPYEDNRYMRDAAYDYVEVVEDDEDDEDEDRRTYYQ